MNDRLARPDLPEYARHLTVAVVRQRGMREALTEAYHAALALLHEVTVERDLLREDRNRLLDEVRALRRHLGIPGVRGRARRGQAA